MLLDAYKNALLKTRFVGTTDYRKPNQRSIENIATHCTHGECNTTLASTFVPPTMNPKI